jgi:hypothetical protein
VSGYLLTFRSVAGAGGSGFSTGIRVTNRMFQISKTLAEATYRDTVLFCSLQCTTLGNSCVGFYIRLLADRYVCNGLNRLGSEDATITEETRSYAKVIPTTTAPPPPTTPATLYRLVFQSDGVSDNGGLIFSTIFDPSRFLFQDQRAVTLTLEQARQGCENSCTARSLCVGYVLQMDGVYICTGLSDLGSGVPAGSWTSISYARETFARRDIKEQDYDHVQQQVEVEKEAAAGEGEETAAVAEGNSEEGEEAPVEEDEEAPSSPAGSFSYVVVYTSDGSQGPGQMEFSSAADPSARLFTLAERADTAGSMADFLVQCTNACSASDKCVGFCLRLRESTYKCEGVSDLGKEPVAAAGVSMSYMKVSAGHVSQSNDEIRRAYLSVWH